MKHRSSESVKSGKPKSILAALDHAAVSEAARRESRNREVHLPPLGVFRWWARRTAAVNDAILDSAQKVLGPSPLIVLDPFAGGGTIPLVALRAGHRVHAQDLNPWATHGIARMLQLPAAKSIAEGAASLGEAAAPLLEEMYGTKMADGSPGQVLHTYRVAVGVCGNCGETQRLFPYSLLTLKYRKEQKRAEAFVACRCGHVFEGRTDKKLSCEACNRSVDPNSIYTPRRVVECVRCGREESLSTRAARSGWSWEVVLVERADGGTREFGFPSTIEIRQATRTFSGLGSLGEIPPGSETNVLLRHGFRNWQDLYPDRQRFVTRELLSLIGDIVEPPEVVACLKTAVVGTTEFAGHLCRWDRFYLKCNDATAGHRFNFSTFVPEPNVWGVGAMGRGTFSRRVKSMQKASKWLDSNFGRRPVVVEGACELEGDADVVVTTGDSSAIPSASNQFDLVLTDPPYHDDVQYGELSLLFRTWAGLTREMLDGEALCNSTTGVNIAHQDYSGTLQAIFSECKRVLRPNGRVVFSYANRDPKAWIALFQALHDSGLFAVACTVVHSENETDFKKRDVRSCNEDFLLELAPTRVLSAPIAVGLDQYDPFLAAIASLFVNIGCFTDDWQQQALQLLRNAAEESRVFAKVHEGSG